jgi:hypothetical protein
VDGKKAVTALDKSWWVYWRTSWIVQNVLHASEGHGHRCRGYCLSPVSAENHQMHRQWGNNGKPAVKARFHENLPMSVLFWNLGTKGTDLKKGPFQGTCQCESFLGAGLKHPPWRGTIPFHGELGQVSPFLELET